MVEQEHEVLPTVLPLIIFPQNVGGYKVMVCCSVLQCVAVYCSVLHCVSAFCIVLQYVAVCFSGFQCFAVCCSLLPCVAVCYSVFHCVVLCCSVMHDCRQLQGDRCTYICVYVYICHKYCQYSPSRFSCLFSAGPPPSLNIHIYIHICIHVYL